MNETFDLETLELLAALEEGLEAELDFDPEGEV